MRTPTDDTPTPVCCAPDGDDPRAIDEHGPAAGLRGLRALAGSATAEGVRLILVSESLDVRANLILSDLDCLAPVLHNLSQACQIVAAAA